MPEKLLKMDFVSIKSNTVKKNMEARNNYLFRKKETVIKSRNKRQTKYH